MSGDHQAFADLSDPTTCTTRLSRAVAEGVPTWWAEFL